MKLFTILALKTNSAEQSKIAWSRVAQVLSHKLLTKQERTDERGTNDWTNMMSLESVANSSKLTYAVLTYIVF